MENKTAEDIHYEWVDPWEYRTEDGLKAMQAYAAQENARLTGIIKNWVVGTAYIALKSAGLNHIEAIESSMKQWFEYAEENKLQP